MESERPSPYHLTPAVIDLSCDMFSVPAGPKIPFFHWESMVVWWQSPPQEVACLWKPSLFILVLRLPSPVQSYWGYPGPLARATLPNKPPVWEPCWPEIPLLHVKPLSPPLMVPAEIGGSPSKITLQSLWKLNCHWSHSIQNSPGPASSA